MSLRKAFENGRKAAFTAAIEECQAYAKRCKGGALGSLAAGMEDAALQIAMRIAQRAKKASESRNGA